MCWSVCSLQRRSARQGTWTADHFVSACRHADGEKMAETMKTVGGESHGFAIEITIGNIGHIRTPSTHAFPSGLVTLEEILNVMSTTEWDTKSQRAVSQRSLGYSLTYWRKLDKWRRVLALHLLARRFWDKQDILATRARGAQVDMPMQSRTTHS